MRVIAAIPAAALLAGAAAGFLFSVPPLALVWVLLPASVAGAALAWRCGRPALLAFAIVLGFFGGALVLSSVAWQRAWRPPLRVAFEALARAERVQADAEGRRLPEDDEAFATVEGV